MKSFKEILGENRNDFSTSNAHTIIQDSLEVDKYIDEKKSNLSDATKLMDDKLIYQTLKKLKQDGEFVFDGLGFLYKKHDLSVNKHTRNILK